MVLAREEAESGLRPAVSYLFARWRIPTRKCSRSAAHRHGEGRCGGTERMKAHGAYTIAQDRDSSMCTACGAAIELGAATQVLPADKIADALIARVGGRLSFAGEIEHERHHDTGYGTAHPDCRR